MAFVNANPHALVVPASAQGHVNGCMLLARSLAALGSKVTFVYYSSFYAKLKEKKHAIVSTAAHIDEHGNPSSQTTTNSCSDNGIGSGSSGSDDGGILLTTSIHGSCKGGGGSSSSNGDGENGQGMIRIRVIEDGFTPQDIDKPFFYTPAMAENLFTLILDLREMPTCLISDTFIPWTLPVAERAGIPRVDYWTSTAMSYLLIIHLSPLYSQGIFPEKGPPHWKKETPLMLDHIPDFPPFSSELYPMDIRFAVSRKHNPFISMFEEISACVKSGQRILFHTMAELEPETLRVFEAAGTPVYAIGPLFHQEEASHSKEESGLPQPKEISTCISWLDTQADSSVIYVAFGTVASLSVEDVQELALGLEASGNPFLWVIREDSHGILPEGFLERTSATGLVIGWAPQVEVLAHKAIGGFLSHCGWNSTFEAMWGAVPMLCSPIFGDQLTTSHYLCNVWGMGLELERSVTGGFQGRFVEHGVKALMKGERGLKTKAEAQEIMQLARKTCQQGGHSFTSLQKFYDDMNVKPFSKEGVPMLSQN